MAGSLARQERGVIGQRWQGRMAHIAPDHTLGDTIHPGAPSLDCTTYDLSFAAGVGNAKDPSTLGIIPYTACPQHDTFWAILLL